MDNPKRGVGQPIFLPFLLFLCISVSSQKALHAQVIDFDRVSSRNGSLTEHSYHRIERFLTRVFPIRQMKRYARVPRNPEPTPLRRVTYEVVSQEGISFVLVAYSVQWNEPVNELVIYRIEPDGGPNQVWRSPPWEGSSGDLHLQSAMAHDRNIILFQEGGAEGQFGLASVFTFKNAPDGLLLHDLTPSLPWLRAHAHFPFRTLYGQQISMNVQDVASSENLGIVLSASDEEYNLGMSRLVRPARSWKYNAMHNRFEQMKAVPSLNEPEATNNR